MNWLRKHWLLGVIIALGAWIAFRAYQIHSGVACGWDQAMKWAIRLDTSVTMAQTYIKAGIAPQPLHRPVV